MRNRTLYPISVEGKWGFINERGDVVVEPQFLSVGEFSEGLARATVPGLTDEDRLFERNAGGFVDESGTFAIGPGSPPGYTFPEYRNDYSYGNFHEGIATFWVGDATGAGGYIDRAGNVAIPPKYVSVNDFSEGLACVSMPRSDGSSFGPTRAGFIDRQGEFVIPPVREFVALGFSEGLCVISVQDDDGEWQDSVIDSTGKTVIPPGDFDSIEDFVGGTSRVVKDGLVGCIDNEGKLRIPLEFEQLWEFEHQQVTAARRHGKWFLVDRSGQRVREIDIAEDFDVGRMRSGLATVQSQNKVGYVNTEGKPQIPLRFDRGEEFHGVLAKATLEGFAGYINRQGEFVWKTDCWDEPVRNAVVPPLSDFLPPGTIEALPVEYNRQRVKNAIVFASSDSFESLQSWFRSRFGASFELVEEDDVPRRLVVDFFGNQVSGSFHVVDASDEGVAGFLDCLASRNLRGLWERHRPAVIGILTLDR